MAGRSKVVIVGGGFAGVSAARRLERRAARPGSPDVTLISDSNFLLFTPMLAQAASGALEPTAISAPVRAAAGRTRFRQGRVEHIDTELRTVGVVSGGQTQTLAYDHLVLAVGSVPRFLELPGVEDNAFTLKSFGDASRLRNHVLALLERSDRLQAGEDRTRLLTFVVAGGGFAGTEIVAELFDLVHGVSYFYPGVVEDEARFVLVHSGARILPELSAELGEFALARLRARGIEFRLGARVGGADSDGVRLTDGTRIRTATFVWTAGNRPSSLVDRVGGEHGRGGGLVTDAMLRVIGAQRLWAVGDCAQVPDPSSGGTPYPPTAQHALRQGKVVADNIIASLAGREPSRFRFTTIGVLVALGHRTAAAEIRGRRFAGVGAWLLWRGIYLAKLPGAEKRIRVLMDWLLDLAFPRDIVITDDASATPTGSAPTAATPR
jgi:NADH dehydrogenase